MDNEFTITKEIMAQADTYIPVAMKELLSWKLAEACIHPTYAMRADDADSKTGKSANDAFPIYCESMSVKNRYLMTILLSFYMKIFNADHPLLCNTEEYDGWAGNHVLNQIERFKQGEYREKAFDILSDYRETEKYLNSAIYALLREKNDPAKRIMEAMNSIMSAEAIQEISEQMEDTLEGIRNERERQERIIHGEEGEEADE